MNTKTMDLLVVVCPGLPVKNTNLDWFWACFLASSPSRIWVGGTQNLTTTTDCVLHHLGHSKLVKKGKVRREEDVKQT